MTPDNGLHITSRVEAWCTRNCQKDSTCPLVQMRNFIRTAESHDSLLLSDPSRAGQVRIQGSTILCVVRQQKGILRLSDRDVDI